MEQTYSIITEKNCEKLTIKELKERFKIEGTAGEGFVDFTSNNEKALRVCYFSQSAKRIIIKIGAGKFKDLDELVNNIKKDITANKEWEQFLASNYRITCARKGAHEFNSVIVEQEISGILKQEIENKGLNSVADYNTKELVFFVNVDEDDYLFGIDYSGKDLSKRHYLFFNNPIAVKGTLAFNCLLFSDYKPGRVLLDCFALAGVIPIEAALYEKNLSVHAFSKEFYFPLKLKKTNEELLKKIEEEILESKFNNIFSTDASFPNLSAQKKNSRIAGVEKNIAFSRTDIQNLDIKNFKKDIDLVCSRVIEPSKKVNEKKAIKMYEDFFYSAKEFLKKNGTITFMVRQYELLEEVAKKYDFDVVEKLETAQGQQNFFFVKFKKK